MSIENQQVRLGEMSFHLFALLHSERRLALWKNYKVAQKWKFYPKVEIADMPKMEISTFSTWAEREPNMAPDSGGA
jgi:hypothetical protein